MKLKGKKMKIAAVEIKKKNSGAQKPLQTRVSKICQKSRRFVVQKNRCSLSLFFFFFGFNTKNKGNIGNDPNSINTEENKLIASSGES